MLQQELFKLEREAEKRVHEARDREIDRGGPGSARRASEAMDPPMLEVARIRKMRQRLSDKQMEIDHQRSLLRRTQRNSDLPPDVKGLRIDEGETKLGKLTADYKALEAEAEQRFIPVASRSGEPRIYFRDSVTIPALPEQEPRDEWMAHFPRPELKPIPPGVPDPRRAPAAPVRDFHPGTEQPAPKELPISTDRYAPPFRMVSPVEGDPDIRNDVRGLGVFWAGRRSKNGKVRPHQGIDIEAAPGSAVRAPVQGYVTKIKLAYPMSKNPEMLKFKYIEFRTNEGYHVRLFYVSANDADGNALIEKGTWVEPG